MRMGCFRSPRHSASTPMRASFHTGFRLVLRYSLRCTTSQLSPFWALTVKNGSDFPNHVSSTFARSLPRSRRDSVPASFGTLFSTAAYTTPPLAILADRMLPRVPRISPISNLTCPIFLCLSRLSTPFFSSSYTVTTKWCCWPRSYSKANVLTQSGDRLSYTTSVRPNTRGAPPPEDAARRVTTAKGSDTPDRPATFARALARKDNSTVVMVDASEASLG
mmetsp:Transcript_8980/g.18383  ORF Transcript_8980/g.18383 Transcript_8980/m.18383 type:complete len:220 (-) Transcript_8980:54-713(-)